MILRLLLERPIALLLFWVAGQFGLICLWSWRRSALTARMVWIGFATLPVSLAINVLVVTPRERIISVCNDLAGIVQKGDAGALALHLDSSFQADNLDRDAFVERARQAFQRYRIDQVRLSGFEVVFHDSTRSTAEFAATCSVRTTEEFLARVPSYWRISFVSRNGVWLVTGIEALPSALSPIRDLRHWIR